MGKYLVISVLYLCLVLLFLYRERRLLQKARDRVHIRVHVNGTRGKSTIVRYIGLCLRFAGVETFAKVTGEVPTVIMSGGLEKPIRRRGPARVHEQISILRQAGESGANAAVIECMSLQPENQEAEAAILRPTLTIIANVGEDHFDEMGKTVKARAQSLCRSIPAGGNVVTAEDRCFAIIEAEAKKRNASVQKAKDFCEGLQLPAGMFKDNINIALTTMEALGFPAKDFLPRILNASHTISPLYGFSFSGKQLFFLNGFSVNDVPSAGKFVRHWTEKTRMNTHYTVILNTRGDRPRRTKEFCMWLRNAKAVREIIVIGSHTLAAKRYLRDCGKRVSSFTNFNLRMIEDLLMNINVPEDGGGLIVGMGNIAGAGYEVLNYFKEIHGKQHI